MLTSGSAGFKTETKQNAKPGLALLLLPSELLLILSFMATFSFIP